MKTGLSILTTPRASMLSSLLRPSKSSRRQVTDRSRHKPSFPEVNRLNPPNERSKLLRHDQSNVTMGVETGDTDGDDEDHADAHLVDEELESDNEDGIRDEMPLLPIFSAAHLGSESAP